MVLDRACCWRGKHPLHPGHRQALVILLKSRDFSSWHSLIVREVLAPHEGGDVGGWRNETQAVLGFSAYQEPPTSAPPQTRHPPVVSASAQPITTTLNTQCVSGTTLHTWNTTVYGFVEFTSLCRAWRNKRTNKIQFVISVTKERHGAVLENNRLPSHQTQGSSLWGSVLQLRPEGAKRGSPCLQAMKPGSGWIEERRKSRKDASELTDPGGEVGGPDLESRGSITDKFQGAHDWWPENKVARESILAARTITIVPQNGVLIVPSSGHQLPIKNSKWEHVLGWV